MATTSSGFFIQGNFGNRGNFQLVVPSPSGGIRHYWRDNDSADLHWNGPEYFASGFAGGASLLQTNFGTDKGNFEVVLQESGRLAHYWREDEDPWRWLGPIYFGQDVTGSPCFIQDRFGGRGNFDVVVPLQSGGLGHFWRDNDSAALTWNGPTAFATDLGVVDAVAVVESTLGTPGNLEVIARVGGNLFHTWRDSGPAFAWSDAVILDLGGLPAGAHFTGQPGLAQSSGAMIGNLELVAPLSTGGLAHFTRNNNAPGFPWSPATVFGTEVASGASVIESNFGNPGNLEVAAGVGERVVTFWRGRLPGDTWRGPFAAAAAEPAENRATAGEWTVPFHSGVVGVQTCILHTGKVLFYSYKDPWNDVNMSLGECTVMDPLTGEISYMPMDYDLFCAGPVHLKDGSVFVAGGQNEAFHQAHVFTPAGNSGTWQFVANMSDERWYPTVTALPDGSVFIISGTKTGTQPGAPLAGPEPESPLNDVYEVYSPTGGMSAPRSAAFLNQASPFALFPHVYLLPGGELFIEANRSTWFLRLDGQQLQGPLTTAIDHPRTYPLGAGGVLLPLRPDSTPPYRARIMLIGGGNEPLAIDTPAAADCEILDLGVPNPQWQAVASMAHPRVMPDPVLLPDGTVFVTNGSASGMADNMVEPVFQAEVYDPATNTWTELATMRVPRLYHAAAVLLPDARVLTAGTDGTFNPEPFNIPNTRVEIFAPPYLFKGPRPQVLSAPASISYGSTFAVTTAAGQGASIASVALIRPGSTTHGVNMDQRYVGLEIAARSGDTLTLQAPPLPTVAPPGYYMLFLVNNDGVPSVAPFVHLE